MSARSRRPRTKPGTGGPSRPPAALTGTPGVGKSTVARLLRQRWPSVEVAALARASRTARRLGRDLVVDLPRLRRVALRLPELREKELLVGHLAHLLPVRQAIVLRCHPVELLRRLARARRGTAAERRANAECEALDLVLAEAVAAGLAVYEVDTTGRRPRAVAAEVARRLRAPGPSRFGRVDWLADRSVTEHLLDAPG